MNMDKRQRIIAVFLVVAVAVLAWQVYALFGDKSGSSTSLSLSGSHLQQASDPTTVVKAPVSSAVPAQANAPMTPYQQQYMKLVNEYQMLQMQNMIAQSEASIAKSRAQTAEAISKLNDLSDGNSDMSDLGVMPAAASSNSGDYELIYTGQENGQWTATLKKGGQFNDVTAGSTLPDGTKVLTVDDNGVLIDENNVKKLVTFNGTTPFTATPAAPPATAAPAAQKVSAPAVTAPATKLVPAAPAAKSATPATAAPLAPKVVATSAPAFDITTANKNDYTVQLIAKKTEDTVDDFITQNKLGGKALAIKVKQNGKLWYIGVYGDFLTVDEANKAIEDLPSTVKTEGPFARRIGNVLQGVVK